MPVLYNGTPRAIYLDMLAFERISLDAHQSLLID